MIRSDSDARSDTDTAPGRRLSPGRLAGWALLGFLCLASDTVFAATCADHQTPWLVNSAPVCATYDNRTGIVSYNWSTIRDARNEPDYGGFGTLEADYYALSFDFKRKNYDWSYVTYDCLTVNTRVIDCGVVENFSAYHNGSGEVYIRYSGDFYAPVYRSEYTEPRFSVTPIGFEPVLPVPAPATAGLLGIGVAALAHMCARRRVFPPRQRA